MKDLVIIGGGFSGLTMANMLLDSGYNDFCVLERLDRVGKKILVTGNGRCNLTNARLSQKNYHGQDPAFCAYAIERFDNFALENFFSEKGLLLTKEGDKYFPLSKVANCVLDALRMRLEGYLMTDSKVISVTARDGGFLIKTASGQTYFSKKVVFACGGAAGQNLGTDGEAFSLIKAFGHTVTDLYPSLTQFKCSAVGKGLKGIKQNAKVGLYDDKTLICTETGDFLFGENQISGNTVFALSSRYWGLKKPLVKVDFAPEVDAQTLYAALKNKIKNYPALSCCDALTGFVHGRLATHFASIVGVTKLRVDGLNGEDINALIRLVKEYELPVDGVFDFKSAQVTHGGVTVGEVDNKTFESKLVKGLYIVGEALDIDGDCGGYNLQWAFSSAACAAEGIINARR